MSNENALELKNKINERIAVVSGGDIRGFKYNPDAPVKCNFSLVLDNTLWTAFCASAEELMTTPTLLLFLLMEQFLFTTGKLIPGYRNANTESASDPITVTVEDIDLEKIGSFFGLGKNKLLKPESEYSIPRRKKNNRISESNNNEFDDMKEIDFMGDLFD
jgi:hypothetical protein